MNIPDLSGVHNRQVESVVSAVNVGCYGKLCDAFPTAARFPAYIARTVLPLPNNVDRI